MRFPNRDLRLPVFDEKNSECVVPLRSLDWQRGWWTDGGFLGHTSALYLHVWHKDGGLVFRVWCKAGFGAKGYGTRRSVRIEMSGGRLFWLVGKRSPK